MRYRSKYEAARADPADGLLIMKTGEWRYQRPITSVARCCQCGSCYLSCPVGCVVDTGACFEANLEYCKGCGICSKICPVYAISMVREEMG